MTTGKKILTIGLRSKKRNKIKHNTLPKQGIMGVYKPNSVIDSYLSGPDVTTGI